MPPFDGTPHDPPQLPATMPCLVIGGCADGAYLTAVKFGAEQIELRRPLYKKPLESVVQKIPEIANESDRYNVFPMLMEGENKNTLSVMAIAVVAGRSQSWGVRQLLLSYVQKAANEQMSAGLKIPTPPNPDKQ